MTVSYKVKKKEEMSVVKKMKPRELFIHKMYAAKSCTCPCLWKAAYLALTILSNFKRAHNQLQSQCL